MNYRYLLILCIVVPLKGMYDEQEIRHYAQTYAPSPVVHKELDALLYEDPRPFIGNWRGYQRGRFFIKDGVDRLKGKEVIEETIRNHVCTAQEPHCEPLVFVPRKWIYELPANYASRYDYIVRTLSVASEVVAPSDAPFNLPQTKQICRVVRKTKDDCIDVHGGNIVNTPDGRVAFIDTEWSNNHLTQEDKYGTRWCRLWAVTNLPMTPEAHMYAENELKKEEARQEIHLWVKAKLFAEEKARQQILARLKKNFTAAFNALNIF